MVNVPEPTLRRLPWYLAYLKLMKDRGETFVSSTQISKETGVDSSQVAKDLSYVNISGKTRVGYEVATLVGVLEDFLGFTTQHEAVLIGVGSLGGALLQDSGLRHRKFRGEEQGTSCYHRNSHSPGGQSAGCYRSGDPLWHQSLVEFHTFAYSCPRRYRRAEYFDLCTSRCHVQSFERIATVKAVSFIHISERRIARVSHSVVHFPANNAFLPSCDLQKAIIPYICTDNGCAGILAKVLWINNGIDYENICCGHELCLSQ